MNQQVLNELKQFITDMAMYCIKQGYAFNVTDKAYDSFKQLKADYEVNGKLTISSTGSESAIYGESVNILFRFYHDVTHIKLDKGFSTQDEMAVVDSHMIDAKAYGLSYDASALLYADTAGQVEYYAKHKTFINDQAAFIADWLGYGRTHALNTIY